MEHRQTRRYQLNASVTFLWDPVNGGERHGKGNTRDISVSGAYIITDSRPPVRAGIQMTVTLPPIAGAKRSAQLFIHAQTVRVDSTGFAVAGKTGFELEYQDSEQHADLPGLRKLKPKDEALLFFPGLVTRA